MADIADDADAVIQAELKHRIRAAATHIGPKATGRCLYCESPVIPTFRWCDTACRDDWELERRHLANR